MLLQSAIDKQTEVSISAVPVGILTLSDIYDAILHVDTEQEQSPLVLSTLKKVPSLVRSRSSTGAVSGPDNTPTKASLQGSLVMKYSKTNRGAFVRTKTGEFDSTVKPLGTETDNNKSRGYRPPPSTVEIEL